MPELLNNKLNNVIGQKYLSSAVGNIIHSCLSKGFLIRNKTLQLITKRKSKTQLFPFLFLFGKIISYVPFAYYQRDPMRSINNFVKST